MVPSFPSPLFGAVAANGQIWMWGKNESGQCGDHSTNPHSSPVQVVGSTSFAHLFFGNFNMTVCALDTAGNAWAWGNNLSGVLGTGQDPAVTQAISSPVQVVGGLKFRWIWQSRGASGIGAFFGLDFDGQLWAWGDNTNGNLGDGTLTMRSSPVMVLGVKPMVIYSVPKRQRITVVPGQTYNVQVGWACKFGDQIIGYNAKSLSIEFVGG